MHTTMVIVGIGAMYRLIASTPIPFVYRRVQAVCDTESAGRGGPYGGGGPPGGHARGPSRGGRGGVGLEDPAKLRLHRPAAASLVEPVRQGSGRDLPLVMQVYDRLKADIPGLARVPRA